MLEEARSLPDDLAALKAMVVVARDAELRNRYLLIEELRHQLAGLRRQRFGATSVALDRLQPGLEHEEIARTAEAPPGAGTQPKRRHLPDHLPREETVLATGERCADCGGPVKRLGEDVTEELEYVPDHFVVKRIARPRRACGGCENFHQAPFPPRPIERGRPSSGLLVHVLVSKYCDHLQLYRRSCIFAGDGVDLDRSTLAAGVGKARALLSPLAEAIEGQPVQAGARRSVPVEPVRRPVQPSPVQYEMLRRVREDGVPHPMHSGKQRTAVPCARRRRTGEPRGHELGRLPAQLVRGSPEPPL